MKKICVLAILLIISSLLIGQENVYIKIWSPEPATGTVYQTNPEFATYEGIVIEEGITWVPYPFDFNCPIEEVTFSVGASSHLTGATTEQYAGNWVEGSYPYEYYAEVMLYFPSPEDIKYFIYTNNAVEDVTINFKHDVMGYIVDSQSMDLLKGWTEVTFSSVHEPVTFVIEVIADGVADENLTIESTTNYDWNGEYYYNTDDVELVFENKPLHSDWNWESFPKLDRTGNNAVDGIAEFESITQSYVSFELEGTKSNLYFNGNDWFPESYSLQSSDGMKFKIANPLDRSYAVDNNATRLAANTPVDLNAGWNWIGYWLPHSQMTDVAFGEHWENVRRIKAENWYYDDMKMERGNEQLSIYSAMRPKPLHYGEGYYVYLYEPIDDFQWNYNSVTRSENFVKEDTDNFTYEVKADYEAIEIVDIDPDIQEIGVYESGVCVGATKVKDDVAQILAYTDRMNRNGSELTFEIVSGRGNKQSIADYKVYKKNQFKKDYLQGGKQEFSIVKLGKIGKRVSKEKEMIHACYPNPNKISANRDNQVTISFEKINSGKTTISVYNLKGQKVKTILNGFKNAGKQIVTWDLKDSNNKGVSSGIYFYKISEPENETTGKMILIK